MRRLDGNMLLERSLGEVSFVHNVDDILMKLLQFLLLDYELSGCAADGELARG